MANEYRNPLRLEWNIPNIADEYLGTEFSSEIGEIWGDRPINSQMEVAEAILTACADKTLNGETSYTPCLLSLPLVNE